MAKINHSDASWQNQGRVVLTTATGKVISQPTAEQVKEGKKRIRLEDLKNEKDLKDYVKEIWE